jgi:hypothetical protein
VEQAARRGRRELAKIERKTPLGRSRSRWEGIN